MLRIKGTIHSFWTHDGTLLAKVKERSRPTVVNSKDTIDKLHELGGDPG